MALFLGACPSPSLLVRNSIARKEVPIQSLSTFSLYKNENCNPRRTTVRACCFNMPQEPILKEALKEPVAFFGGMFAGLLRLDLNDEPVKEWITRTVEASGMMEEDIGAEGKTKEEEAPQQIQID